MNLFRIVPKRTNKRKYHDNPYRDFGTVLLFVFLLPYVMACLWGHIGEETELFFGSEEEEREWIDEAYEIHISGKWGIKNLSMQEYLIQKLEMTMPREEGSFYETEALKAQAVLLRTELLGLFLFGEEEADDNVIILQDDALLYREKVNIYTKDEETPYREAVCATDGIYLSYENKPVKAAYFPISNGRTRNADEVMQNSHYPYLISVECPQDILAEDYQSHVTVDKEEYCRMIRELFAIGGEEIKESALWEDLEFIYDSAEYVAQAEWNGRTCSGERFRNAFGLNSASFYMEWGDDGITFYVKGVGHGYGMSQYGANKKAASGETFDNILENYFFQAELVKIE